MRPVLPPSTTAVNSSCGLVGIMVDDTLCVSLVSLSRGEGSLVFEF